MPSLTIDTELCTALLRAVTDQIAVIPTHPGSHRDVPSVIRWVKKVSQNAANKLRGQLSALYPEIGWSEEERRPEGVDAVEWLYDPVDGAYHYTQGLPLWSSSLVLIRNGAPVFSAVYDPTRGEIFVAMQGQGVTCNGTKVFVSSKAETNAAVVGTAIPPLAQVGEAEQDQALSLVGAVSKRVFVIRPMAAVSLQLAYVASGRLDAYWENGKDVADWLAGSLLVTEAGGVVSDLTGRAFGWSGEGILAGNATLHGALMPVVSAVIEDHCGV
jgi:myo-inositol-1(or 4)-monophosphatase